MSVGGKLRMEYWKTPPMRPMWEKNRANNTIDSKSFPDHRSMECGMVGWWVGSVVLVVVVVGWFRAIVGVKQFGLRCTLTHQENSFAKWQT